MDHFKNIFQLLKKHQTALSFGSLSLLAAVSETALSTIVYTCPCNSYNYMYGLVFLLVPALILFLLGYMLSIQLWEQVTACCNNADGEERCCLNTRVYNYLWRFIKVACVSALAPLTWIALALLKASFYECIISGLQWDYVKTRYCDLKTGCPEIFPLLPCLSSLRSSSPPVDLSKKDVEEVLSSIRAESQILGWILIAAVLLLAALCICIKRCCSPVHYQQRKFWKTYITKEQKIMDKKTKELATRFADRNVTVFLEQTQPDPFIMPTTKEWKQLSSPYSFKANMKHYSMIHKLVDGESRIPTNEASSAV
uniref:Calcium homeostasis modulator family member 6 n=1 Tax=Leptobrachium leishanense TaxID=445787 RepID=A0A8C5PMK0_9ANUR